MTVGIYSITNKINLHQYVGQSRNIEKRWQSHIEASKNKSNRGYDYPLYRGFRKYGINNFDFSVLEKCEINELNEKEKFWISKLSPVYNQTAGGDYTVVPKKLTAREVEEIQAILVSDQNFEISNKQLGERYGVSGKDTIRDINVGRTWYRKDLMYPLRVSKYDGFHKTSLFDTPNKPPDSLFVDNYEEGIKEADREKFIISLYEEYLHDALVWIKKQQSIIYAINKNNGDIKEFSSVPEATNFLVKNHITSNKSLSGIRSHIWDTIHKKRKTAYGFYWYKNTFDKTIEHT